MDNEESYIRKRLLKANIQSLLFYVFRIFPIKKNRIVFCTIEGTTGYTCNPKYIAEECIKQNKAGITDFELIWLVNDTTKIFPKEIRVVKNNLVNRAYYLTTAKFWIDNSRKQLEARKRKKQIYIQTWHAKLGFKPTCLDRGASFSKIAYMVSKHDSDLVDYWLSNSDWYDATLKNGSLYEGKTIRSGSPRCDILVNRTEEDKAKVRKELDLPENAKILMYAPTFRGGSQGTKRSIEAGNHMPDFNILIDSFEHKFGGIWFVLLRLHPQLTARNISNNDNAINDRLIDVSKIDDMYEILAGCDAFMTDYSSAAFDAAVMKIPIVLFCDDYEEYENERGKLLWDLKTLPFEFADSNQQIKEIIKLYSEEEYLQKLDSFGNEYGIIENGTGSTEVVNKLKNIMD